jgi:hypothetical protein
MVDETAPETNVVEEHECAICMLPIIDDKHNTRCNHTFHTKCIEEWYKRSAKQTCTMCRNQNAPSGEDPVLLELRRLIRTGECWTTDFGTQASAIDRFYKGQLSYAEMRMLAG